MNYNLIYPSNHKINKKIVNLVIPKFQCKNYKIVHISDIHIGYYLGKQFLEKLIEQIIDINPNICVITGDLIAYSKIFSIDILTPLQKLTSKIDTYFVLGNHEVGLYKFKIEEFLNELQTLGVYTLHN